MAMAHDLGVDPRLRGDKPSRVFPQARQELLLNCLWQSLCPHETAALRVCGKREKRPFFRRPDALIFRCRRKPAMAINVRRNKPFGPGGSTRRLHPSPPPGTNSGLRRGRTRIDEGVKDGLLLGMVPPLSGRYIVANDNYAPVAQAA
jgi:hypothetical protein